MAGDIFAGAQAAYDECVEDLRKMARFAESVDPKYNARLILNRFDVLLQYSLLQIALADGYLHVGECAFIKDLAQYSDLCIFLNECGFDDVTWYKIYNTRESYLNRILDDSKDVVVRMSADFITIFSVTDALTEYDFLADLRKNVMLMILATCQADGNAQVIELANDCLIIDIINKIEESKKEIIEKRDV